MKASSLALPAAWRTPVVVIVCGCLIAMITFGPRSSLGLFLTPLSAEQGWGRDVFALALAIQNLLWGIGQPFAGAVADRFGTVRVFWAGAVLYGLGIALMAYSTTPLMLDLTAGVLIGFGLSGCSFNLVLGAFGKLVPEEWRGMSLGAGTAAGSFGQFLFSPLAAALNINFGWQTTLVLFGLLMLAIIPLALAISTPPAPPSKAPGAAEQQSLRHALAEAFGHRSYILLVLGFFTCGFQLAFITVHLPAYLVDRGLSLQVGAWTIAMIGLFNIVGSLGSGWLMNRYPKRYLLSAIYFGRAAAIVAFILLPASIPTTLIFGAFTGLLWLSTVPPTSALVSVMFGTRWLAMLFGFCFFSHQVGGFLGVLLGGIAFEKTGSYDLIWWLSVFFGVASAIINLPIVEKPVQRTARAAA
jgi:MFS family permease